jgi:hypothetical protein
MLLRSSCCCAVLLSCRSAAVVLRWREKLVDIDVLVMTSELLLHCLAHASLQVRGHYSQTGTGMHQALSNHHDGSLIWHPCVALNSFADLL